MPSLTLFRGRQSYFAVTRAPRYSLVFALPLLLAYEALAAALTGPGHALTVRNGADVMLKELFVLAAGERGPLIFMGLIIGLSVYFVVRDVRRTGQGIRSSLFAGMLAESVLLATLFGLVIGTITVKLLGSMHVLSIPPVVYGQPLTALSWPARLMLSLGAGLYEELLFRVLLVSALTTGARRLFGWGLGAAGVFATIVGALIFSAFHYIGPYGDPFQLQSFVYRALSGVAFSAIYLTRGFGITAWTHALYDAFLLL